MQDDPLIRRVILTPELSAQLDQVNTLVNNEVTYVPDLVKYNVAERWEDAELENDQGDCEDYVIAKRRRLRDLGWPMASLDIARCLDEKNIGHATLVVRTDQGDLVLDNRQAQVWRWDQLAAYGYRFLEITVGGLLTNWRTVT